MLAQEPVVSLSVDSVDDLSPDPIDPSWIIDGNPQARSRQVGVSPNRTITATIWETSAGRFDWHYSGDEMIHIVAGEAELTFPSGRVTQVRAGDMIYFPGAQIVRWHVPTYVRKVALYSARISLPRRLAHRIPFVRRIVRRARARSLLTL